MGGGEEGEAARAQRHPCNRPRAAPQVASACSTLLHPLFKKPWEAAPLRAPPAANVHAAACAHLVLLAGHVLVPGHAAVGAELVVAVGAVYGRVGTLVVSYQQLAALGVGAVQARALAHCCLGLHLCRVEEGEGMGGRAGGTLNRRAKRRSGRSLQQAFAQPWLALRPGARRTRYKRLQKAMQAARPKGHARSQAGYSNQAGRPGIAALPSSPSMPGLHAPVGPPCPEWSAPPGSAPGRTLLR